MTTWIAEQAVTWVLPSGERRAGRIAIGHPEYVEDADGSHTQCAYVLDGLGDIRSRERRACGEGSLQALWHAMQDVGHELYWLFCDGVRVVLPQDEGADPQAGAASLLGLLGPLVRAHGNPRGPADPDGKLAELEALHEKQRSEWEDES